MDARLHSRDQAKDADLLVESIDDARKIICTFSEAFIMRLRRRIAEGKLSPGDVKLFMIEEYHTGLEHKEFTLDESGCFKSEESAGWPMGFFDTVYQDVCAIRRARRFK